ncbi:methylenetetrahydrofolate reductase [NAD(P)H] [Pelagibaculum spongiae]|uniref:Methylenetetrahydrofolate reductase n=1 Tax=Pelagibaculum spongiae TaxID=2080658 RepID=A0A2V1GYL3_9GAMM|nr:methylenetetrahydrofolate reductase [NAD(P)H] [Pelagibaculum spongiae]PVZ72154.1 methylenetetrahydrofolate reductase [NAD(P)H] [Pelagibaculum spongiae]
MRSQLKYRVDYSFEFFPPKTDKGAENIKVAAQQLAALNPKFFSCTFGAGGSTQEKTGETVSMIKEVTGIATAPHLSCIGSKKDNIRQMLLDYKAQGIDRIVALRGDMPSGMGSPGELRFANELVEFIREVTGDHFHIEVAAYPEFHPQSFNADDDLKNFKRKVEAGANSAITQYFFNPDSYFRYVDSLEKIGVDIPVVPGIMPITNYAQLARFSHMCGAEIPRWLRKRLEGFYDDREAIADYGIDVISELCRSLLEGGAPGLHFYTLNRSDTSIKIFKNLGLTD